VLGQQVGKVGVLGEDNDPFLLCRTEDLDVFSVSKAYVTHGNGLNAKV
jgi:hypothetical protein